MSRKTTADGAPAGLRGWCHLKRGTLSSKPCPHWLRYLCNYLRSLPRIVPCNSGRRRKCTGRPHPGGNSSGKRSGWPEVRWLWWGRSRRYESFCCRHRRRLWKRVNYTIVWVVGKTLGCTIYIHASWQVTAIF